ncbi:hypothetical protein BV508_30220, partial [Mycobacterium intermedium]
MPRRPGRQLAIRAGRPELIAATVTTRTALADHTHIPTQPAGPAVTAQGGALTAGAADTALAANTGSTALSAAAPNTMRTAAIPRRLSGSTHTAGTPDTSGSARSTDTTGAPLTAVTAGRGTRHIHAREIRGSPQPASPSGTTVGPGGPGTAGPTHTARTTGSAITADCPAQPAGPTGATCSASLTGRPGTAVAPSTADTPGGLPQHVRATGPADTAVPAGRPHTPVAASTAGLTQTGIGGVAHLNAALTAVTASLAGHRAIAAVDPRRRGTRRRGIVTVKTVGRRGHRCWVNPRCTGRTVTTGTASTTIAVTAARTTGTTSTAVTTTDNGGAEPVTASTAVAQHPVRS